VAIYAGIHNTRKQIEQSLASVLNLTYPLIRRVGITETTSSDSNTAVKFGNACSIVHQFKDSSSVRVCSLNSDKHWGMVLENDVYVLWIRAGIILSPDMLTRVWAQGAPEHNVTSTAIPTPTASIFELLMFRHHQMEHVQAVNVQTADVYLRVPGNSTVTEQTDLCGAVTKYGSTRLVETPNTPFNLLSLLNSLIGLYIYVSVIVDGVVASVLFVFAVCIITHVLLPMTRRPGLLYYLFAPLWTLVTETTATYHLCSRLSTLKRTG
jgi:hypothetical protein